MCCGDDLIVIEVLNGDVRAQAETIHVWFGGVAEEDAHADLCVVRKLLLACPGSGQLECTEETSYLIAASEGADGGPLVRLAEALEPARVELGQLVGNVHQPGKIVRAELGRGARDASRLPLKARRGGLLVERGGEIEGLGGGEKNDHRRGRLAKLQPIRPYRLLTP